MRGHCVSLMQLIQTCHVSVVATENNDGLTLE